MIRKYAEIFCWKNVSSFCSAKATRIFSAKNIRTLCIESTKTVNEMTLNELVKLTTLWTTGPRTLKEKKKNTLWTSAWSSSWKKKKRFELYASSAFSHISLFFIGFDRSGYQVNIFLVSPQKHTLLVLN